MQKGIKESMLLASIGMISYGMAILGEDTYKAIIVIATGCAVGYLRGYMKK